MNLQTLIKAQMELLGDDMPAGMCGIHGKTRKEVILQAIEYLEKQYQDEEKDEFSEYGYRIQVEIFKKGKPKF